MTTDFETSVEQHALEYIKLHLREGYFVSAYTEQGKFYWQTVYKIKVSKEGAAGDSR